MNEYEQQFRCMGTECSIALVMEQPEYAETALSQGISLLREFEERFSRFSPSSELSQLNDMRSLVVTPLLYQVLTEARDRFMETQGAFNPLIQVRRQGYQVSYDRMKTHTQHSDMSAYNTRFEEVVINPETRSVTLHPGQELDLGGFVKGFAAEYTAKRLRTMVEGMQGIIVNVGGDIATFGTDEYGDAFTFEIDNPITKTTIPLILTDACLATSGTYRRRWVTQNGITHHLIARDGVHNPQTPYISVSVIHAHGGTADAYTKAVFCDGPVAIDYLGRYGPLRAVLIHEDGDVTHFT